MLLVLRQKVECHAIVLVVLVVVAAAAAAAAVMTERVFCTREAMEDGRLMKSKKVLSERERERGARRSARTLP